MCPSHTYKQQSKTGLKIDSFRIIPLTHYHVCPIYPDKYQVPYGSNALSVITKYHPFPTVM